MQIKIIGGGPGGLFAATLLKKLRPADDVSVFEQDRAGATFGFGVVFSTQTLRRLQEADPVTYEGITGNLQRWDTMHVHVHGRRVRVAGHGFSGLSRRRLLSVMRTRCKDAGVELYDGRTVDSPACLGDADVIVASDGIHSRIRNGCSAAFTPKIFWGQARFTWLGIDRALPGFTFLFREDRHGLWQVHAYPYATDRSTFIVETDEKTWRSAGLNEATEKETAAFVQALFQQDLQGAHVLTNRSIWRQFPEVRNERWSHNNLVLLGDAAHSAHFSIGSGTKLALDGAHTLATALARLGKNPSSDEVGEGLRSYEAAHRPRVLRAQQAATVSQRWFERAAMYHERLPATAFTFSLMTRSGLVCHQRMRSGDPAFVDECSRAFHRADATTSKTKAPMFAPGTIGGLVIRSRIGLMAPEGDVSSRDGDDTHQGVGLVYAPIVRVCEAGCAVGYTIPKQTPARTVCRLELGPPDTDGHVPLRPTVRGLIANVAADGFDMLEVQLDGAAGRAWQSGVPEGLARELRRAWPAPRPLAFRLTLPNEPAPTDEHFADQEQPLIAVGQNLVHHGFDALTLAYAQHPDNAMTTVTGLGQLSEWVRLRTGIATIVVGDAPPVGALNSLLLARRADAYALHGHEGDRTWLRTILAEQNSPPPRQDHAPPTSPAPHSHPRANKRARPRAPEDCALVNPKKPTLP